MSFLRRFVSTTSFRSPSRCVSASSRPFSTIVQQSPLVSRMNLLVPSIRSDFNELKKKYGNEKLGDISVGQVLGGMRGMIGLYTETSLLDANEGIRFRGHSIPDLQRALPRAYEGGEPLPEGLLWLLLTGEVPSAKQVEDLTADLHRRSKLPSHVLSVLSHLPKDMHPMTQLINGVTLLQTDSKFARAYHAGVNKNTYWEYVLEDSLDLIARLPQVAAAIYRNKFHHGHLIDYNVNLDYGANFAHMLGFDAKQFAELMRLYLVIHADHEGGNVSAHATHLVGSALADPYLAFSAGMAGLAGPLHGLANQEVLRWLEGVQVEFQDKPVNKQTIEEFCWKTLHSGRVIPGYGHAVLRRTDPRYSSQREFALKHLPNDKMFKLVSELYGVVPDVLTKHGKTANPWPNVDAHSGVLLQHFGLKESEYYTVLFGVSRAIGVLSSLTLDRITGLPLERPKSIDSTWIQAKFKNLSTPSPPPKIED